MRKPIANRLLLLLVVVVGAIAAAPASATAATFRMHPCVTENSSTNPEEWVFNGQTVWSLRADCLQWTFLSQNWLALPSQGPASASLKFARAPIETLSLTILAGDGPARGVVEGFAVCGPGGWPTNCGPSISQEPGDPITGRTHTLTAADNDFPANADRIVLHATCNTNPYCVQGTPMKIRDVSVALDDATPPRTLLTHSDAVEWHNASAGLALSASEPDSSLSHTNLTTSLGTFEQVHCDNGLPTEDVWGCTRLDTSEPAMPMWLFRQGTNTVTATTFNSAGLSANSTAVTKVDTIAPPMPQSIGVGANPYGFVNGLNHVLRWTSAAEGDPTPTKSGVVSALIDIDPAGSDGASPPPFTAHGIGINAYPITLPGFGSWTVKVTLTDAAGNVGITGGATINADLGSAAPPTIPSLSPVTAENTSTGVTLPWYAAGVQYSPVCGYRVRLDPAQSISLGNTSSEVNVDVTQAQWNLTPAALSSIPDANTKLHVQTVACSGAVSQTVSRDVIFDRALPTATIAPESGWLTANDKITISGSDGGNGAVRAVSLFYKLDDGLLQTTQAPAVQVPVSPGRHALTYYAVDGVGNRTASKTVDLGHDAAAPIATFAERSSASPAHIDAQVGDAVSGLADAWMEIGPATGGNWRRVGTRFISATGSTNAQLLSADLPDDGTLPDGDYRLRVFAKDIAGNETYSYVTQSGADAAFSIPLRSRPRVTFGFRGSAVATAVSTRVFDFGAPAALEGQLLAASGAPLAGAALNLIAQVDGGGRRLLGALRTDADGRFASSLSGDVSRNLTVVFAGDAANGSATSTLRQVFRAGVTLHASARSITRGKPVLLRGRIALLGASIPARGKRVEFEFCARNRCTSLNIAKRTRSDGSFILSFPTSTARPGTTYRIRARAPGESGWPFADGVSEIVKFKIKSK